MREEPPLIFCIIWLADICVGAETKLWTWSLLTCPCSVSSSCCWQIWRISSRTRSLTSPARTWYGILSPAQSDIGCCIPCENLMRSWLSFPGTIITRLRRKLKRFRLKAKVFTSRMENKLKAISVSGRNYLLTNRICLVRLSTNVAQSCYPLIHWCYAEGYQTKLKPADFEFHSSFQACPIAIFKASI